MKTIFAQIQRHLSHEEALMLVSVVANQGSSPRSAGARMLIGPQGRLCGTIGGGAVEYRSQQMAAELLAAGKSHIHEFALHQNEVEDIGMVCGGDVTVLFRYIPAGSREWQSLAQAVLEQTEAHRGGWLLDRLTEEERVPCLWTPEESWGGDLPEAEVLQQMQGHAPCLVGEWFGEPLPVGERVIIFGGGHVAQALAPVLRSVGFRPVIFENREEFARPELFPSAEGTVLGDYKAIGDSLAILPEDYVVVMTHGHKNDYDVEAQALAAPHAYLGVIGSRAKVASVNRRLLDAGFTEEQIESVYTPIGVPIRSETPAEIAISIAAEMIRVRAERRGAGEPGCPMH